MLNRGKYLFGKEFFEDHHDLLLKFVNTKLGKWFFRIHGKRSDVGESKIIKIAPNFIEWLAWEPKIGTCYKREFRTHNKYTKRIYYSLYPIWVLMHAWDILFANNFKPAWNLGFDTLTAYPDPNVESTSVD